MSQCTVCEHNGYQYVFSTSRANFLRAQGNCEDNDGSLARYLDEDACLKLRKCCSNNHSYWIGLVENEFCDFWYPRKPYNWINDNACTNANPLSVNRMLNSIRYFQAVTISLTSDNLEHPPESYEENDNEIFRYICQYEIAAPTSQTTFPATQFIGDVTCPSAAAATSVSIETLEPPTSSTSSFGERQQSTLSPVVSIVHSSSSATTISAADDSVSSGLVVGLVVEGTILLIALVLLYFFIRNGYYKTFNVGSQNSSKLNPQYQEEHNMKEVKENPLYGRYLVTLLNT